MVKRRLIGGLIAVCLSGCLFAGGCVGLDFLLNNVATGALYGLSYQPFQIMMLSNLIWNQNSHQQSQVE
jgi:hypothetical protein